MIIYADEYQREEGDSNVIVKLEELSDARLFELWEEVDLEMNRRSIMAENQ